jgi:putative MATE family efflux protein
MGAGRSPYGGREVWAISLPLLLAEVGEVIIHVTDTALLARVGTVELGAIALADELLELWLALTIGLAQGIQIQIARRVGERRGEAMLALFRRGFAIAALLGAVLAIGLVVAAPHLGEAVAGPGPLGEAVGSFLRAAAPGLFFEALNLAYSSLVVGTTRTRVLILVTSQVMLTNLVFGYVLIFGRLGFPALGIAGAGWAYVVTEALTFVLLSGYMLLRYGRWYRHGPREAAADRPLWPLLRLSLPVTLEVMFDAVRWLVFFLIVARLGEDALAMSNIVYSVFNVLLLPGQAFSETATSLVGILIGRGSADRIRAVMRVIAPRAYLATLPLAVTALLFPGAVLALFGAEVTGLSGGETALRLVAAAMLVVTPAEMWAAALEGAGATDVVLVLSVVWAAIVLSWAYVAVSAGLPAEYLWLGLPAGSAVTLLAAYWTIRAGRLLGRRV